MDSIRKWLMLVVMSISLLNGVLANERSEAFLRDSMSTQSMGVIKDYHNAYLNNPRKDLNGYDCFLLKVITSKDSDISFSGNIVGDIEYKDFAYRLYMTEGSHYLQIKTRDNESNLDLNHLFIEPDVQLVGGASYSLCGLDNDNYVSMEHSTEYYFTEDAMRLRNYAHEYIEAFNNRNLQEFRTYYDNYVEGGEALSKILSKLESTTEKLDYSVKCSSIIPHYAKLHIYGMTVEFYENETEIQGYSFLLLDLNEKSKVKNHISTYQTVDDVNNDGLFTLDKFFVP